MQDLIAAAIKRFAWRRMEAGADVEARLAVMSLSYESAKLRLQGSMMGSAGVNWCSTTAHISPAHLDADSYAWIN